MNPNNNIEIQVKKFFETFRKDNPRVSYLLSQLDLPQSTKNNFSSKFPLSSIIRLYLFKKIKGFHNYNKLTEYLIENESQAFQLGFFKDKNNKLKLPPKRTYNNYLSTINKKQLDEIVELILSTATKNKIILDTESVNKALKKEKRNYYERFEKALKFGKNFFINHINLPMKSNSKYSLIDLLDVLIYIGKHNCYANAGARAFSIENSFEESPSGDTLLHHLRKFKSIDDVRDMFDNVLDAIFHFLKNEYNLLNQRKYDIAFDIHNVCYYGKESFYVCSDKYNNGTTRFYKFLTSSIVIKGERFIIDVIPMHPLDDTAKLLDKSLSKIKNKIRIERAYLDRWFDKPKYIRVLNKHAIKFIMPMTRLKTVKSHMDKAVNCDARTFNKFKIGKGDNQVKVNLILVNNKSGDKKAFISNFEINPTIAHYCFKLYGRRWGIETGYRVIEDIKPKTTSKNYYLRLFYFMFSCCLHNLWVLMNICVSLSIHGEIKPKPILTMLEFTVILIKIRREIT